MDKSKRVRITPSNPIDDEAFKAFLKFLSPEIKLLAETYKFASEIFAELGLLYYWEEIFNLPAEAVYKPDCGPWQIVFYRTSKYGTTGEDHFVNYVPKHLLKRLVALSQSNSGGLLFRQEDGSPFNKEQLNEEFRKARQKAHKKGYKLNLTPIQLRTTPPADVQKPNRVTIRGITEERIQKVKELLPESRKGGRPRELPLEEILRPLLVQANFGLTRSALTSNFPATARAAEIQKRRWEKQGIWDQILRIFQE